MEDAALLRSLAIPLAGTDPALPEDDLAPLLARLADARIIGLGEATHGDRESFLFKRRLIQALVRERAFTLVVFERGVAEMDAYDRYVTGMTPTLTIGDELYPWTTEEVRDLLAWLREWNEAGGSVRVAGMDMQSPSGLPLALRLIEEAGLPVPSGWKCLADELDGPRDLSTWHEAALARWRGTEPPPLDPADARCRWISLLASTFRQWLELRVLARQPDSRPWELRDRFMAENAIAQAERFGAGTRATIWAHNGHVSFGSTGDGSHLRAVLGPAYRSVGFAFGTGRISAGSAGPDGKADWALRTHTAHPPSPGSMEELLDRLDLDCYAIEPRKAAPLRRELRLRNIGAIYSEDWDEFSITGVPAECYDLIVYFRQVRPSRVL